MPEALTLPHHLQDQLRSRGSRVAIRFRRNDQWISLTWAELLEKSAAIAWDLRGHPRGQPWAWSTDDPGLFAATHLALLHLGVPSLPGKGPSLAPELGTRPAPRALLQRLCQELHPRDPAWDGLNQQDIFQRAHRQAGRLGEEALVSTTWPQALAAAAVDGSCLVMADPSCLPALRPAIWLASSSQLLALKLPPSRLGNLGRFTRTWSRLEGLGLDRLQKLWVEEEIPVAAQSLLQRGVQVRVWGI